MNKHIYPIILVAGMMALMGGYLFENQKKVSMANKKLLAIVNSKEVDRVTIRGDRSFKVSAPIRTSDLFDRTGMRQLNFNYISSVELDRLQAASSIPEVLLNDVPKHEARITNHENAISVTLPDKKIYFIAPPHLLTAAALIREERLHRQDIFFCEGEANFCQQVRLSRHGGLTDIKERFLEEDSFFNLIANPRGRMMGRSVQLQWDASRPVTIVAKLDLALLFNVRPESSDIVKKGIGKVRVMLAARDNPGVQYRLVMGSGPYLFKPAVLWMKIPLHQGKNRIRVAFSNLLAANVYIPFETSGVLTRLAYRPLQQRSP